MADEIKPELAPAPGIAEIEALARQTLKTIPRRLRRYVEPVVIRVEDFPDAWTAWEMGLGSPFDLLGLYRGVPLMAKSVFDPSPNIDMIFLYRQPILAFAARSGDSLGAVVRHVLIHEIGHHFGYSDAEMAAINAEP
ncbi:MAG: metallopeptidase family protein [Stellaceae bacterium]